MLVVSNPVDVLTYLAVRQLDLPPTQVIGLGTQLDTARFRSLIAERLQLPPTQVTALILGEHGDSMVPIWSTAQAAGLPLDKFPGWNSGVADAILTRTRGSGAEVIKLKGGAGFAVGISIREVVHAVALDSETDPAGLVAGQRPVRHPRRLHLDPHSGRAQGGREPARDRALAQGNLGAATFGPGPARDDRRGLQEQSQGSRQGQAQRAGRRRPPKVTTNGTASQLRAGDDGSRGRQWRLEWFSRHRLRTRARER